MDEAHFGMSTDIAQKIVECLEEFNSVKIFVTATYNKPLKEYKVDYKNVIKWDLKDIRFIKNISKSTANNDVEKFLEYFDDKFGNKIVDLVLKRGTLKQQDIINISNQYQHFPEPFLITSV
jgi:S-adenosylmethionine synthetase